MSKRTSNPAEIRAIFEKACAGQELLILVTQYLKFESRFVRMGEREVHARTTTGGEEALEILGVSDVRLRFPEGLDFMEASTRMTGLGEVEGLRTVRFALPTLLTANDGRRAPRVSGIQGAYATFGLRGLRTIRAAISNISVTGARLSLSVDLPLGELRTKDRLALTMSLPGGITIISGAIVRHKDYRHFGVEFDPPLGQADLAALSRWVFLRHEAGRDAAAEREDARTKSAKGGKTVGNGILVVTDNEDFKLTLADLLGEGRETLSVPPLRAPFGDALAQRPLAVILHVAGDGEDEAANIKALAETIPWEVPTLLVGTGADPERLTLLGRECRALASIAMTPSKGVFLQRLVLGALRKYYGQSEGPMAP